MSIVRSAIAVTALALLFLAGCGNQQGGTSSADYEKQRAEIIARRQQMQGAPQAARPAAGAAGAAAAQGAEEAKAGIGAAGDRSYAYDPIGKRDPFRSFVLDRLKELEAATKGPLEQFDLNQLSLLGVVWETNRKRALVSDPSGQAYVVSEGDPIGTNEGTVIRIDDNLMLVRETYVDHMGEQTEKEVEMHVRRNLEG
jgi:type IV pilus assembly protein PilP